MPIAKNEPNAAMRGIIVTFYDDNGARKTGLTFSHAAHEVQTNYGGGAFVDAANDAVEIGYGDYLVTFSQAETNHDVNILGAALIKAGYANPATNYIDLDATASSGVILDIQTDVDELQASVGTIGTAVTDIQGDVDAVETIVGTLATAANLATAQTAITDIQTDVDELQTSVAEIAGLHHKNSLLDGGAGFPAVRYTANREFLAGRKRVFASKAARDAATPGAADNADGEIHRYSLVGTGTGTGLQASFAMDLEL